MDATNRCIVSVWPLYYERDENLSLQDPRVTVCRGLAAWLSEDPDGLLSAVDWGRQSVVQFNYDDFTASCTFKNLPTTLKEDPDDLLKCLGIALCIVRSLRLPPGVPPVLMNPRIQNVLPLMPLRELKSNAVGHFASIRGNVVRVSGVRPLVLRMAFTCAKCSGETTAWFAEGKFEPPTKCADDTCRGRTFTPRYGSAKTVDWQKVRVQELEADIDDAGRVPRTVECELTEDLVDSCVPGDVVTIGGVVKAIETDVAAGKGTARAKQLYLLYIDCRSITTHKVSDKAAVAGSGTGPGAAANGPLAPGGVSKQFSEKELQFMARVRAHRDPFSLVIASMCPSIFGQDMVKLGLLLGLFGGTPNATAAQAAAEPTSAPTRDSSTSSSSSSAVAASIASFVHAAPGGEVIDDEEGGGGGAFASQSSSFRGGISSSARDGAAAAESVLRERNDNSSALGDGGDDSAAQSATSSSIGAPSKMHVRCDPHVLVVGDPGMGKSQMLNAVSGLSPRGVYVSGNTASGTGLTVVSGDSIYTVGKGRYNVCAHVAHGGEWGYNNICHECNRIYYVWAVAHGVEWGCYCVCWLHCPCTCVSAS